MSDNLSIWSKVCTTDKRFIKDFKRKGGFVGTAINPIYSVHLATELWGPCGDKWGYTISDETVYDGAPLLLNNLVLGFEKIHAVTVTMYYPGPSGERATVSHKGQTQMVGQYQSGGYWSDEEAPKKSVTDGLTKCLSMLGFSADIYLGGVGFESNKYTNTPADAAPPTPQSQQSQETPYSRAKAAIQAAPSLESMAALQARYKRSDIRPQDMAKLDEMFEAKMKSFQGAP